MRILGKVALITGGAQGLGKEFADQLLKRSAMGVCLLDVDKRIGQATEAEFNQKYGSGKAKFCFGDVRKREHLQESIDTARKLFGRLDIVCNNAGVDDEERQDRIIDINFKAVVTGTQLAIDTMSTQKGGGGGVIVNVASLAGLNVLTSKPLYTGTKHAVVGFSRSVGNDHDFDHHGVRVNCICPGFTETNLTKDIKNLGPDATEEQRFMAQAPMLKPETVGKGFIQLVEDDSLNGAVMRITTQRGIDFQYYKPGSKI